MLLRKVCQSIHSYRKEKVRSLIHFWGLCVCFIDGSAVKMLVINIISRGTDLNCPVVFSNVGLQLIAHQVFACE